LGISSLVAPAAFYVVAFVKLRVIGVRAGPALLGRFSLTL
jgi:hypothetical protein